MFRSVKDILNRKAGIIDNTLSDPTLSARDRRDLMDFKNNDIMKGDYIDKHPTVIDKLKGIQKQVEIGDYKEELKVFEGFRDSPYKDSKGLSTVGYGINLESASEDTLKALGVPEDSLKDKNKTINYLTSNKVNEEQASRVMSLEVDKAIEGAKGVFKGLEAKDKNTQNVITDMTYNMGVGNIKKFKKTIGAYDKGNVGEFIKEIMDSNYYKKDLPKNKNRYKWINSNLKAIAAKAGVSFDKIRKEVI